MLLPGIEPCPEVLVEDEFKGHFKENTFTIIGNKNNIAFDNQFKQQAI